MIRVNLKRIADARGYNIKQLIELTGLHRNTVGEVYKNRYTTLSLNTIDCICKGLKITVAELLEYVPEDQMTVEDAVQEKEREMFALHKRSLRKLRSKAKEAE